MIGQRQVFGLDGDINPVDVGDPKIIGAQLLHHPLATDQRDVGPRRSEQPPDIDTNQSGTQHGNFGASSLVHCDSRAWRYPWTPMSHLRS